MPDARSCVSVTHKMVDTPKVVALTPSCTHGDTEDKPKPVPRISKIRDSAAAAAAPAKIAAHETALALNCDVFTSLNKEFFVGLVSLDLFMMSSESWRPRM